MSTAPCFPSLSSCIKGQEPRIKLGSRWKLEPPNRNIIIAKFVLPEGFLQCRFYKPNNLQFRFRCQASPNSVRVPEDGINNGPPPNPEPKPLLARWTPPRYLWRGLSVFLLAGQVTARTLKGKIHYRNTLQQLERVGPRSVGVCLLTSAFVGMAFTIQFVREFTRLGLNRSVGGVLALAFSRELSPVVTAVVVAGRVGSAFAAELGTMQVSEQTDTLRVLGTNPVDYLVTPRVIATSVALPVLTLLCFSISLASSALLADGIYGVSINIILDSARRALRPWDIISALLKANVFGAIIAIVSCAWGVTTLGGAKGVGDSTTSAVVISLVSIFIADFFLSYFFFLGSGDSLKYAMG
ncbi:protein TRIGALACTOSYLDIACYLGLYCEROL 1, chloroplastic-like [Aristolochia californica]|uniref:protein TRIGALACTOSYLDIACYLGLYCEROL 1, chloroplastic-like n=1 Tax=Aristolochia californica TaxID=171875 RepID=UPI0035D95F42